MSFIHALWLSFCDFHCDSFILEGFYHAFDCAVVGGTNNMFSITVKSIQYQREQICDALLKDKESPQADTGNYHKTNCLIRSTG
jgi:hypothetical protein